MKIETEFDIGDKVIGIAYAPSKICNKCKQPQPNTLKWDVYDGGEITCIFISVKSEFEYERNSYVVRNNSEFFEKNIFLTKKEANAECKRRNGE